MFSTLVLIGLIYLLIHSNNPLLCAGIYASVVLIFNLLFGNPLIIVLVCSAIRFGLAYLYFWLLDRFQGSGILWWIILIVGFFIVLV